MQTLPLFVALLLTLSCSTGETPDPAHRQVATVFATVGDSPTVLDLDIHAADGAAFRLENQVRDATLSGSRLVLRHTDSVHQGIQISVSREQELTETLLVWHTVQPPDAPRWPLAVAENRRHLVDSANSPQVWIGASPWALTMVPSKGDISLYLADRAERGVNVVLVRLTDHYYSDQRPRWLNYYQDPPFNSSFWNGSLDFTSPNEDYWHHVDWTIREAYSHGIAVLGSPAYVGYLLGEAGWADHMIDNGTERLRRYGEWIARRYKDYPNLVWVMGGDSRPSTYKKDVTDEVNAVAEGIKSIDSAHLMTAHSVRNRSAVDDYNRAWLDVNSSYGDATTVHKRVRIDYQRRMVLPTFLIEARYGNEGGVNEQQIRAQMYNALFAGAFGQLYGNAPQWYFSAESVDYAADIKGLDWRQQLDDFGAQSIRVVADLAEEFTITRLTPDFDHEVMTSGAGDEGQGYAPLAYGENVALAYLPNRRTVTIDTSVFEGPITARWRNPADGADSVIEGFSSQTEAVVTPPHEGDWLLILESD